MENKDTILNYWFGKNPNDAEVAEEKAILWWSKDEETDEEISQRFKSLVLNAGAGNMKEWESSIEGRLVLILLTDQFPRNIFRDTPQAFQFDDIALNLTLQGLTTREDKKLRPIQQLFFYLPLEHSENLEHQTRCVQLFRELAINVRDDWKSTFEGFVDFAVRHYEIIDRFGRFPHRNSILGRESTPEEIEFLSQPGSSF